MGVTWAIVGFLAALAVTALSDLISEEARGRLDQVPFALLHLAFRRLPPETRSDVGEEWRAELHYILRGAEAFPITRLVRGTRYALGLIPVASRVGQDLKCVRLSIENERTLQAIGHEQDPQASSARPKDPLASLVASAVAGDEGAKEKLIEEIRPLVLRYWGHRLGRLAGGYDLADEVAQEVCVAVVSVLPHYRDTGRPFISFVYGIAAHKVAEAEHRDLHAAVPVEDCLEGPDDDPGPEEHALRISDAQEVGVLLDRLPEQQRDVLMLRIVNGLSAEETASALGIPAVAVRITQYRALARLRALATT